MTASASLLNGKTVLIPRGKDQARSYSELVKGFGGIPAEIPLIAFRPVAETEEILVYINQLSTYDWIIFTSNIAVETFLSFINLSKQNGFPRIAAIGKKTEKSLLNAGLHADFVPREYVAESFVEEFLPVITAGMKILLPKGNLARSYISAAFSENGAFVDEVIIYETYFPEESGQLIKERLRTDKLDILTFTSPSTVDHFMKTVIKENLSQHLKNCIIGCIGPITKDRIESYGLKVHCTPQVYTVEHMLESIIEFLKAKDGRGSNNGFTI